MQTIKLSYMPHKYLRILLAVLVLGCSQVHKAVLRDDMLNTTGIQEGEAIVVISETKDFRGYQEGKIGECICKALEKQNRKIEIFPSDEFRRTFFSELNLPDEYSTEAVLDSIFTNEATLQHIESLNIHYILVISLKTTYESDKPLNLLVYGHNREKQLTHLSAEIFDIKQKCDTGRIATIVSADLKSKRIIVFPGPGGVLPIPLYNFMRRDDTYGDTYTFIEACEAFGKEVVKFFIGQDTNQ